MNKQGISIIIPVFNEEEVVKKTIFSLEVFCKEKNIEHEIIVVNDGSEDDSGKVLSSIGGINVITHPYNKGYGASLKSGTEKAIFEWVLFYDADGQHTPLHITALLKHIDEYDMVVGARMGYQGNLWRQPGKKILRMIADYAVEFKIPDLNSGLRLVNKSKFNSFLHLYPEGFSLSTTITLAFIKHGYTVGYFPIKIEKRIGKSSVRVTDGFKAINLVLRIIMLFSPMKFFVPLALTMLAGGIISLWYDIVVYKDIADTTTFLFITAIIIGSFGLLADQVAAIRREMRVNKTHD